MPAPLPETQVRHRTSLRNTFGPTLAAALDDDNTTEILINPDGRIFYDTLTAGLTPAPERSTPEQTAKTLSTIAGLLDRFIDSHRPVLEAELPFDGSRIEGVLPPVSRAPTLAIRKQASTTYPLHSYLDQPPGPASAATDLRPAPLAGFAETLDWALGARKNVLVAGATNAAKTSFLNSLFARALELGDSAERFLILEDTFELQCPADNRVNLQTSESVTLADLVRVALRLRPDRIVIGEVRGPEALPMLRAWNTGHDGGLTTVHANSAREALDRLEELCQEAGVPPNPALIARTLDLVVYLRRVGASARVVTEILHVHGHDGRDYQTTPVRNDALRAS